MPPKPNASDTTVNSNDSSSSDDDDDNTKKGKDKVGKSKSAQAVTEQPKPVARPSAPDPDIIPGMEMLKLLDSLYIKQKVELLEAICGFETNNAYDVYSMAGQHLFIAKEETLCCIRMCCGARRPFHIKVVNMVDTTLMTVDRPFRCYDARCCCCCLQRIRVEAPPGKFAGSVEQICGCCHPRFVVRDGDGQEVLKIKGPICTTKGCFTVEFQILALDGNLVGKISKKWSGIVQEAFTDADNLGITFPVDLDSRIKAVLVGAVLLIDFIFYEDKAKPSTATAGGLLT